MPDGSAPRPEPLLARVELAARQPCLGRIVEIDDEGRPRVSFGDLVGPPPVARILGEVPRAQLEAARAEGRAILLAFLEGRADSPVIMSLASMPDLPAPPPAPAPVEVRVDDDPSVRTIEANERLVLRCGEASITLEADGTVKIRGRDVTSWARRRQRIRGGSVAIN